MRRTERELLLRVLAWEGEGGKISSLILSWISVACLCLSQDGSLLRGVESSRVSGGE